MRILGGNGETYSPYYSGFNVTTIFLIDSIMYTELKTMDNKV